jgi:Cytosol aminopeptidase family, N-terminal domain
MNVSFLASELGKWDHLDKPPEALMLPFFADERPLRGAAGLCDWRLCGRLSRLLAGGRVRGGWGETTLYPTLAGGIARLPFGRLVLFGLGPSERFDEAAAHGAAQRIAWTASQLGLRRYALVPPGRSTGRLSARRALELYLTAVGGDPLKTEGAPDTEIVVVESPAGQKEAADLARHK